MMERRRSWPARIAGWCRRDAMREGLDRETDRKIKLEVVREGNTMGEQIEWVPRRTVVVSTVVINSDGD
jgi:hypothetical protein